MKSFVKTVKVVVSFGKKEPFITKYNNSGFKKKYEL